MFHFIIVCCGVMVAMPADSPTAEDLRAYQAAAASADRDPAAHVRLASWCEAHGMQVERHRHLAIALEIAPDHATAHGLLGQVFDKGEWRIPEAVIADHKSDAGPATTLASYHARRDKSPDTAQAQWQLAEWCEQNGLTAEARVHLTAVVRLNPAREEAWKKLGYRKQKGVWTKGQPTAGERAMVEAQHRADARWFSLFQKWSASLAKKSKRAEAEAAMAHVHDARAVPSIWKVFISGGPADQERAVRLLGQIDAPAASRALAWLAVLGASADVRNLASESLSRRDPREFASLLISLLRDEVEYEVRPVGGPGSPGELYVHGERANRRFFYEAPPPLASVKPTDILGFDNFGLLVANRVVGFTYRSPGSAVDPLLQGVPDLTGAPQVMAKAGLGPAGVALGQRMLQNQQQSTAAGAMMEGEQLLGPQMMSQFPRLAAVVGSDMDFQQLTQVRVPLLAQVPVGQLMVQAQRQADYSRARLEEDVLALKRFNQDVSQVNERVATALEAAVREKPGPKRQAWVKWWNDLVGTATAATPPPQDRDRERERESSQAAFEKRAMLPSFGEGTPVWTLSGLRAVEAIRAGDQILTEDTVTGALAFTPVLLIDHPPRQPVKTVAIAGAPLVVTDLERFWVAGKGWVKVLDLKPGEAVRALGGVVRLGSIENAASRPVYHVQVAAGRGIIVGQRGILAHDERVASPAAAPFDSTAIEGASRPGRVGLEQALAPSHLFLRSWR